MAKEKTARVTKKKDSVRDAFGPPKQPLSGWVRYMNDRRESIRAENPKISFSEITRLLASEWNNIPQHQKQKYLDAADQERVKYMQEMALYKKTEAYRKKNEAKAANNKEAENNVQVTTFDIPIFTEEFLEFNRAREYEVRRLRKLSSDLEQQNSVLNQHLDVLKQTTEKMQGENVERHQSNYLLKGHLQKLREKMVEKLAGIRLPTNDWLPNFDNIDKYIEELHRLVQDRSNSDLIDTVKAALSDIDAIF